MQIIHEGPITLEILKELVAKHLKLKDDSSMFNPVKNNKAIAIIAQDDGNWKGFAFRNGKEIEVRAGDPNTALNMIITHS